MSCQFSIYHTGAKTGLVTKLKQAVASLNGQFNGDEARGEFSGDTPIGSFHAGYKVLGDVIEVTVHKKPFLVSCSRIEKEINSYLGTDASSLA